MARITIEDCKKEIPNRFELVLLAAQRARGINTGDVKFIAKGASVSVMALKEIASGTLDIDKLRDSFILSQQEDNIDNDGTELENINVSLIERSIIESELIGQSIIENEAAHDNNFDISDINLGDDFDNLLLEKS